MFEVARMVTPTFVEVPTITKASNKLFKLPTTPTVKAMTLSLHDFNNLETRPQFLRDMRKSLMELGTFYIKDHGISTEMTGDAMKTIQDYFALPLEEKKKMLIANSRHFRGYKLMGEEFTNNQVDHREQLQFGPEQTENKSFKPTISPDYEGLQGPNLWPASTVALLPDFKPCILDLMNQLETLSQTIMEAVALSLGLKATYFRDLFGETPYYRLKCAKYPSVNKAATIGCGAHKDTGFLTVLFQDMVGGLQGQDPATGQWLDTKPIPDTFIVTMGEAIEKMTGGLYNATVHRVLNNTSGKDRYSIPFFFDPSLNARIPFEIENLDTSAELDYTTVKQDQVDELAHKLGTSSIDDSTSQSWSSGAHIFETVHRCHPEVYARWYNKV
ncbi:hypothetical protein BGX21_008478 [Mortierella sp. AD011]|nr:hypothetical protein BGX20_004639 [Mortierella sp. AD010]KAF9397820.1 hypothetical protein BGX21_008478 [Mortierella sp. AD011]